MKTKPVFKGKHLSRPVTIPNGQGFVLMPHRVDGVYHWRKSPDMAWEPMAIFNPRNVSREGARKIRGVACIVYRGDGLITNKTTDDYFALPVTKPEPEKSNQTPENEKQMVLFGQAA